MVKHFKPEKKHFASSASLAGVEKKSHSTSDFRKNIKNMHADELDDLDKQQKTQIRMMKLSNWMMQMVLAFTTNHQGDVAASFVACLIDHGLVNGPDSLSDICVNTNIVIAVSELALGYQASHTPHPFSDCISVILRAKALADRIKVDEIDLDRLRLT